VTQQLGLCDPFGGAQIGFGNVGLQAVLLSDGASSLLRKTRSQTNGGPATDVLDASGGICPPYEPPHTLSCREDFGQRNWWILLRCQCWLLITIVDFVRPPVTERGVTAPTIVKPLDIADNVAAGL
jgi:hypothetical protein